MELAVCLVIGLLVAVCALSLSLKTACGGGAETPESREDIFVNHSSRSPLPPVTYRYPALSGENPFDIHATGDYFLYANGLSYLSENPGDFSDPHGNETLRDIVPMGYKTLIVYRRSMLIMSGRVLKAWEDGAHTGHEESRNGPARSAAKNRDFYPRGGYSLFVNATRDSLGRLCWSGITQVRPDASGWSLGDHVWDEKGRIAQYALGQSIAHKDYMYLVSLLVDWHCWH